MEGNYIYFFYDSGNNLLYIGKTINLRNRLRHHFAKEVIEIETWKQTVNKDNIIIHECNSLTDLELYETYFINKYKPLYNSDKVFNDFPTFDLPYLEPQIYQFKIERIKGICFTNDLKYYCEMRDNFIIDNEEEIKRLESLFPIFKEAYENLGSRKLKSLSYTPSRIASELSYINISNQELIRDEIKQVIVPGIYPFKELKEIASKIFLKLNINKNATSSKLLDHCEYKVKTVRKNNKVIKMAEIIKVL